VDKDELRTRRNRDRRLITSNAEGLARFFANEALPRARSNRLE